jgi:DNA mismatch repair protein MutL
MAIQRLPPGTVRIIGSSQVLTTPASLVKELIDNGLDANASSIDILISSNTLDTIQVRDNGHGIDAADLESLGRRGYTSKLRSFEDLRNVGARSLGFRGEALASAVELGEVTLTTRTEGEVVATTVKLKKSGGIDGKSTISHPVGTTVSVTNFLSKLPVRKQAILKESKKTLATIKHILQSYALARLNVRLKLRVLKSVQHSWSFAPRPNPSIREVVSQVIGRDVGTQCMELTSSWNSGDSGILLGGVNASVPSLHAGDATDFHFQVFAPRLDADFSKIDGGHHVSIDSRPVSCSRGVLKKIITMYRTQIKIMVGEACSNIVKDPFIRLNIICPAGSYDPNVEPAKDDVIFADEPILLAAMDKWLATMYPKFVPSVEDPNVRLESLDEEHQRRITKRDFASAQQQHMSGVQPTIGNHYTADLTDSNRICGASYTNIDSGGETTEKLVGRKIADVGNVSGGSRTSGQTCSSGVSRAYEHVPDQAMLATSSPEIAGPGVDQDSGEDEVSAPLNPWIIAKLVTPINNRQLKLPKHTSHTVNLVQSSKLDSPVNYRRAMRARVESQHATAQENSPPESPEPNNNESNSGVHSKSAPVGTRRKNQTFTSRERITLDFTRSDSGDASNNSRVAKDTHPALPSPEKNSDSIASRTLTHSAHRRGIQGAINSYLAEDVVPLATRHQLEHQSPILQGSLPTKSPRHHIGSKVGNHYLKQAVTRKQANNQHVLTQNPDNLRQVFQDKLNGYLVDKNHVQVVIPSSVEAQVLISQGTMPVDSQPGSLPRELDIFSDESRQSTILPRVEHLPLVNPRRLPADFRQSGVEGVLDIHRAEDRRPAATTLTDGDPRAYLMRRKKSMAASEGAGTRLKLKRARTNLLPLELIPESARLHHLVQVVTTKANIVGRTWLKFRGQDEYVASGRQSLGLCIPRSELGKIESALKLIVRSYGVIKNGEQCDIVLDLGALHEKSMLAG